MNLCVRFLHVWMHRKFIERTLIRCRESRARVRSCVFAAVEEFVSASPWNRQFFPCLSVRGMWGWGGCNALFWVGINCDCQVKRTTLTALLSGELFWIVVIISYSWLVTCPLAEPKGMVVAWEGVKSSSDSERDCLIYCAWDETKIYDDVLPGGINGCNGFVHNFPSKAGTKDS